MSKRKDGSNTALVLAAPSVQAKEETLKAYALVELFGHQRLCGLMTVDPPEFPGMVKVEIPDLLKDGKVVRAGFTRYLGRTSLYGVTPITREMMLQLLPAMDGTPATPLSLGSYNRNGREEEDYG